MWAQTMAARRMVAQTMAARRMMIRRAVARTVMAWAAVSRAMVIRPVEVRVTVGRERAGPVAMTPWSPAVRHLQ